MGSTPALARGLGAAVPSRPTALDAFKRARRRFLAGTRIEMQALANELRVSRVTLHRWVGSRDELLGEIIWSVAEPTLRDARRATRSRGGKGIAETMWRFLRVAHTAPFFRAFLEREPEIGLRVLTTKRTPFQSRFVTSLQEMLAAETEAGRLDPPMALDDLAYLIIRLSESFLYTDLIAGGQPNPDKARQAIGALLR